MTSDFILLDTSWQYYVFGRMLSIQYLLLLAQVKVLHFPLRAFYYVSAKIFSIALFLLLSFTFSLSPTRKVCRYKEKGE